MILGRGRVVGEALSAHSDVDLVSFTGSTTAGIKVGEAAAHTVKRVSLELKTLPDGQISMTDPDARSMATSGKGSGMVGYNVQMAVDAKHHLIVAHEVTNIGNDRAQLSSMARAARDAMGKTRLKAVADRGYFSAQEIKACADTGIAAILPKPTTSSAKAGGRFDRADFIYIARDDEYYTASPEKSMDCSYAAIGVVLVLSAPCGLNARRVRTGASPDGSMRKCWRPSSADSTRRRMQ